MDVLSALPFDVACDVLACGVLSPADVASLARVSRAWHALATAEPVWHGLARRSGLLPHPSAPDQGPRACVGAYDETGAFATVRSWRALVCLRHALARHCGTDLAHRARAPVALPAVRHVVSLYAPFPAAPDEHLVTAFRENIAGNRIQRRIIPLPRHQALLVPGVQGDAWVVDTQSQHLLWGTLPPLPPVMQSVDQAAEGTDAAPPPLLSATVDSDGDQVILTAQVWGLKSCQVNVFRADPDPEVRGQFDHVGELPVPGGLVHGPHNMLKVNGDSAAILAGGRTFVQWDLHSLQCTHITFFAHILPTDVGTIMPRSFDYDDHYIYLSTALLPSRAQGWPPATWDDLFVFARPKEGDEAKLVWSLGKATATGALFGSDPTFIWKTTFDPISSSPGTATEASISQALPLAAMTPLGTAFARDATCDAILIATGRGVLIMRGCAALFGGTWPPRETASEGGRAPIPGQSDCLVAVLDFGTDDESHGVPTYWPGSGHAQLAVCQGRALYVSPTGRTLLLDYQVARQPSEVRVIDLSPAKSPSGQSMTSSIPFAPISACPPPSAPTPLPVAPAPSGRTTAGATPMAPSASVRALALTRGTSFQSPAHRSSFASPLSRRPSGPTSRHSAPRTALRVMAAEKEKEPVTSNEKERGVRLRPLLSLRPGKQAQ